MIGYTSQIGQFVYERSLTHLITDSAELVQNLFLSAFIVSRVIELPVKALGKGRELHTGDLEKKKAASISKLWR